MTNKPKSLGIKLPPNLFPTAKTSGGKIKPAKSKGKRRGEMNRLEAEFYRVMTASGLPHLRYEEMTIVAIRAESESGQQDTKYTPDFTCEFQGLQLVLEVKGRRITKDIHRFNAAAERRREWAFFLAEKGRNGWTLTPRGGVACENASVVRYRILGED